MKLIEPSLNIHQVIESLQIGDEFFWEPLRLTRPGAWTGHLMTAFWLTKVVKPRVFVELGTHSGNSYSAFCQAISRLDCRRARSPSTRRSTVRDGTQSAAMMLN